MSVLEDSKHDAVVSLTRELSQQEETAASVERWKKQGGHPIFKVVLTGGPCGGKTTAGSVISSRLQVSFILGGLYNNQFISSYIGFRMACYSYA